VGQRLRVAGDTGWQEGRAMALRADTLWLAGNGALPSVAVPLTAGTRLERFARPTASYGAKRGARIGVVVGLVAAVVWCAVDQTDCRSESGRPGSGGLVLGTLRWMPLLGATGGAYGALAGVVVRGPARWHPVRTATAARVLSN
jgi:hypothetical protein